MTSKLTITATNCLGKMLLAMRPGKIDSDVLYERCSSHAGSSLGKLTAAGLAEKVGEGYQLTEAGRKACPSRRAA